MGFNQMITNEELSAIVDNYCRRNRLHKRRVELTKAEDELKEVK